MVKLRNAMLALIALLLVFAQQYAVLHPLFHDASEPPAKQQQGLPGAKACEKCVAFAKFSAALPAPASISEPVWVYQPTVASPVVAARGCTALAYLSRAPPRAFSSA